VFVGVREGLLDLLQKKERTNQIQNVLTVAGLSAITSAALVVKDVSFILAIAGATLGNALIYVYPALMFRAMVSKKSNASNAIKRESRSVLSLAFLGVIFGIIGAGMAVKSVI
jgi:NhaP-type Na+/H+ or K+/H+ antiporter